MTMTPDRLTEVDVIVAVLGAALVLAPQTDSVRVADIQRAYALMIRVEAVALPAHDTVFALRIDAPPSGGLLERFYSANMMWFDYLIRNGRGFRVPLVDTKATTDFRADGHRGAAQRAQSELTSRIVSDSSFNAIVIPAIAAYLRASGVAVSNSIGTSVQRVVQPDSVMKLAVRFFYPDILTSTGIHTHICTELNAVRELPKRDPALEATVFSAIMNDVQRDPAALDHDIGAASHLMNELDAAGAPDSVRLRRAQGVMWGAMSQSTTLRALLLAEAKRQGGMLPFTIGPS
jgi:hypothetical protein